MPITESEFMELNDFLRKHLTHRDASATGFSDKN